MRIKLTPQRRDDTMEVVKAGNALTVNGEAFDFSRLNEGDTLPGAAVLSDWFVGDVDMVGGELTLTLLLPLPANFSPEQAFPVDLVAVPDGPVIFPQPLPEATQEGVEQIMADNAAGHFVDEEVATK